MFFLECLNIVDQFLVFILFVDCVCTMYFGQKYVSELFFSHFWLSLD